MSSPILILSNPRTGSTLLRYIVDSHPRICCPGELRLGALCELLGGVLECTLGQIKPHPYNGDMTASHFQRVRQIIDDIMLAYCNAKGKDMWCEKTPQNLDHLPFLEAAFPDARYICMYRHGLDSVRSEIEMRHPEAFGEDTTVGIMHEWVVEYIERWCQRTERLIAFERAHAGSAVRVTYEQLVDEPEEQMKRVWMFLDVEPIPGLTRKAFDLSHDDGPGDYKIVGSSCIDKERIGHGLSLDVSRTPAPVRRRMVAALDTLGYV